MKQIDFYGKEQVKDVGLLSSSFGNDEVVFQPSIFRVYVSFREGIYTYLPRHEHDFLLLEPPFFQTRQAHGPPQPHEPQKQQVKIANGFSGPPVRLAVYLPRSRIRNFWLPGDLLARNRPEPPRTFIQTIEDPSVQTRQKCLDKYMLYFSSYHYYYINMGRYIPAPFK